MTTSLETLQLKIQSLQAALEEESPGYKEFLAEIHFSLRADPEVTNLLKTDGEISVIFEAMRRYKNVEIPTPSRSPSKTSIPKGPINLDQF